MTAEIQWIQDPDTDRTIHSFETFDEHDDWGAVQAHCGRVFEYRQLIKKLEGSHEGCDPCFEAREPG